MGKSRVTSKEAGPSDKSKKKAATNKKKPKRRTCPYPSLPTNAVDVGLLADAEVFICVMNANGTYTKRKALLPMGTHVKVPTFPANGVIPSESIIEIVQDLNDPTNNSKLAEVANTLQIIMFETLATGKSGDLMKVIRLSNEIALRLIQIAIISGVRNK